MDGQLELNDALEDSNPPMSMNGMTIDYTCSGGIRYVVRFHEGTVSYWAVGASGWISNRNDNIPYRHTEIRPGLIYTVFHEQCIGDIVTLVIDMDGQTVHFASLLGYPSDDRRLQFEHGEITSISRS